MIIRIIVITILIYTLPRLPPTHLGSKDDVREAVEPLRLSIQDLSVPRL